MDLIIKKRNGVEWVITKVPIEQIKELIDGSRDYITTEDENGWAVVLRVR